MAGRKMNRKMEVSDVVSVLREVLEGGPPSQEDLFEPRYKPARGSDFAYDVFDARIDGSPGTCGYDAFPKLCERVRAARGARLAVALMLLVPSAGPAAVAKARWERVDLRGRQWTVPQAHRIPGRPAGERTFKLSSQAMRVLEAARQLALGNDDGAALVFERRRKLASSNSTTDSDYRHLMDLPAPRARRGTPRGLVFRGRRPRRPVSVDTIKAVLRDAGASSTEIKSVHMRWWEATSDSRLVGQGMAWDERGGPLEQWGAQLEPGLAGLI